MKDICFAVDNDNQIAFQGLISTPIPNRWNKKKLTYCIAKGSNDIKGDTVETFIINLAFEAYELELDLKFERVRLDQKPDFDIRWVQKKDDTYFTSDSILAYCGYPQTSYQGILRFNDDVIWTPDGKALSAEQYTKLTGRPTENKGTFKTYNGNQTARHELGHGLGGVHTEDCKDCLLYPYYNKTLFPQTGDLKQLLPKYGKRVFKSKQIEQNLRAIILDKTVNWDGKWQLNI